ncbi:MAG: hypothetical protein KF820_05655 [Candidatus Paracaedibacteraceae bacterium]|nr:hypothetical protein [Candidatus Paracaedibacteraceae bacterium]
MKPFDDNLYFCLRSKSTGAITQDEFNNWCYECIKMQEDIPTIVFDLLDFGDHAFRETRNDVFFNENFKKELSPGERNSLRAIGYLRGINTEEELRDLRTSSKTVLSALEKNPHILERFKEVFPFIKLEF